MVHKHLFEVDDVLTRCVGEMSCCFRRLVNFDPRCGDRVVRNVMLLDAVRMFRARGKIS